MSLPVARLCVFFSCGSDVSPAPAAIVRLTIEHSEARQGAAGSAIRSFARENLVEFVGIVMIVPGIVAKSLEALTFLATIGADPGCMQFLAMISILALLTMSGAAISDQFLTADQHVAQGVE